MSVQPGPTFKRYAANGVATVYAIPFLLLDAADLQITLNGAPVTTGFTLSGIGSHASSCTFSVAPTGDLLFQMVLTFQRLADYQTNGDFLAGTVNRDYDRLWLAVKQLARDNNRGLTVSLQEPEGIPPLPAKAVRSLKMLAFDVDGNPVPSNLTLAQIEQQPALALDSAAAAAASASAAGLSETAAAASEDLAQKWAENPENSAVVPGSYSAFHWSRKALASAIAAAAAAFSVKWAASNLKLSATGTSAVVQITADEINLTSSLNASFIARAVNISLNIAAGVGAGGLDDGTLTAATRYYVWLIATAAGSVQGIISKSSTAPTMPATYVYSARVGSIYTAASGSIFPLSFIKAGKNVQLKVAAGSNLTSLPSIASGTTPGTYSAAPVAPVVPPTAVAVDVVVYSPNVNGLIVGVAPNASYSTSNTSSNFAPVSLTSPGNAAVPISVKARLLLESANLYYLSNFASATVLVAGWEEDY